MEDGDSITWAGKVIAGVFRSEKRYLLNIIKLYNKFLDQLMNKFGRMDLNSTKTKFIIVRKVATLNLFARFDSF